MSDKAKKTGGKTKSRLMIIGLIMIFIGLILLFALPAESKAGLAGRLNLAAARIGLEIQSLSWVNPLFQIIGLIGTFFTILGYMCNRRAATPPPVPPEPTVNNINRAIRLSDGEATNLNSFKAYNYKFRVAAFIGREDVMAALDGFMAAPARKAPKFQWWALYGEAGSGKSRVGLELCHKYREKNWRAGLLHMKGLCMEDWRGWRPEGPTLIVLDYAAYYLSGLASSPVDPSGLNIADALRQLCENQDQFEHPVRFLLLERSSENVSNEASDLNQPLHKRLTGDSRADCADLDQARFPQEPLLLPKLKDEDLAKIGHSLLKDEWPPALTDHDFIEKLKELDAGKMRPLFVIMLALFLKESGHAGDLSKESILQQTLMRECNTYWRNCRLDKDDIHLLILATISGGLDGLPDSVELPDLWAEPENESPRRFRFDACGLSQRNEDSGSFIINPIEPDLLGEYFVLSGCRQVQKELNGVEMPESRIHTLIWESLKCETYKTLTFLGRCVDDFPDERLFRLHEYMMEQYRNRKEEMPEDLTGLALAALKSWLIWHCLNAEKLEKARILYDSMPDLGQSPDIALVRAKAAVNLISAYRRAGDLEEARRLYDSMPDPGQSPDIALVRAEAAVNLILDYGNAGDLEEARRLYDSMPDPGQSPDIALVRAKAAFNLISAYGNAGDLEEARRLYDSMPDPGQSSDIDVARAKALVNLISAYAKDGRRDGALYDALTSLKDNPEVQKDKELKHAIKLIMSALK